VEQHQEELVSERRSRYCAQGTRRQESCGRGAEESQAGIRGAAGRLPLGRPFGEQFRYGTADYKPAK